MLFISRVTLLTVNAILQMAWPVDAILKGFVKHSTGGTGARNRSDGRFGSHDP